MVEGVLAGGIPRSGKVLFGKVNEWVSNVEVVRNETSVEVHKIQEGANILQFGGCGPGGNPI